MSDHNGISKARVETSGELALRSTRTGRRSSRARRILVGVAWTYYVALVAETFSRVFWLVVQGVPLLEQLKIQETMSWANYSDQKVVYNLVPAIEELAGADDGFWRTAI